MIDKNESKVLDVTNDLEIVGRVVKISSIEIMNDMNSIDSNFGMLNKEYDKLQSSPETSASGDNDEIYRQRLQAKIQQFALELKSIDRYKGIMSNKITEVIEYFGEDASVVTLSGGQQTNKTDISKIFSTLQIFRKAVDESKVVVERRERSDARNNSNARDRSLSRERK